MNNDDVKTPSKLGPEYIPRPEPLIGLCFFSNWEYWVRPNSSLPMVRRFGQSSDLITTRSLARALGLTRKWLTFPFSTCPSTVV